MEPERVACVRDIDTKPVLSRLKDTPWYHAAMETLGKAKEFPQSGRSPCEKGSEKNVLVDIDESTNAAVSEFGENSSTKVQGNEEKRLQTLDKGNHASPSDEDLRAEEKSSSHPESEINLRHHQGAVENIIPVGLASTYGEGRNEAPATDCQNVVEGRSDSKDVAVEVTVYGIPQGTCEKVPPIETRRTHSDVRHNHVDSADPCQERSNSNSTRSRKNLSKSPISVITLTTKGDNTPATVNETSSLETLTQDADNHELRAPRTSDDDVQQETQNKTDKENYHEPEDVASPNTQNTEKIKDPEWSEAEQPSTRRRLSKTIQQLQEKIQQEMAENENRVPKGNHHETRISTSPRKLSGKSSSRFLRERSRKRSKSRAAFKVFHCSLKTPVSHSHTKERPYRQWAGVGNCVTHDTRYIVCSTRSRQDLKLSGTGLKIAATEASADDTFESETISNGRCVLGKGNVCGEHGKGDTQAKQTNRKAKEGLQNKAEIEDDLEASLAELDSPYAADILADDKAIDSISLTVSPEMKAQIMRAAEAGHAGSRRRQTVERSRSIKKRVRPPTPHADYASCSKDKAATHTTIDNSEAIFMAEAVSDVKLVSPQLHGGSAQTQSCQPRQHGRSSKLSKQQKRGVGGREGPCNVSDSLSVSEAGPPSHHGSVETLWSDASSTTWESNSTVPTDAGALVRQRKAEYLRRAHAHTLSTSNVGVLQCANKARTAEGSRKYIDVQAVADFKGSLPGQLSLRKGQLLKKLQYPSPISGDDMSYGYYRVGRFKRKRKGLFPSSCVAPCVDPADLGSTAL